MSDITISYKGADIATMDASGTKTLLTEGKYCEDDITLSYTKPSGGSIPHVFSAEFTPEVNTQALSIALDFTYCPTYVYIFIDLDDLPSTRDVTTVSSIRLYNNVMSYTTASWAASVGRRTITILTNGNHDFWTSTPDGTITPTSISLDVSNKNLYFLAGLTYHIIAVEVQPE